MITMTNSSIQFMSDWSVVAFALLTIALFAAYLLTIGPRYASPLPPLPVRPDPFLGHLRMVKSDFKGTVNRWSKDAAGGIFSIYFGSNLVVVISRFDILKAAFVKQADFFSDRPWSFTDDHVDGYKGVITASGEHWRENRSVLQSIFRKIGQGKNTLAERINEEVDAYLDTLKGFNGSPKDIQTITTMSVSNIMCSILGKRFNHCDENLEMIIKKLNTILKVNGRMKPLKVFSLLRFLPGDPFKLKNM